MSVRCPDAALAVRPPGPALPGRSSPAPGRHFLVSGFQTEVTFPKGVASAVAQMSPITGKVTATVRLVGAIPDSRAVAESFVATIPASVPAAGFNFWVPARAVGLGIFTAASKAIAVEEASRFRLTLGIGQRGRGACTKRTVCAQNSRGISRRSPQQGKGSRSKRLPPKTSTASSGGIGRLFHWPGVLW